MKTVLDGLIIGFILGSGAMWLLYNVALRLGQIAVQ
jgi:hypothetical protein